MNFRNLLLLTAAVTILASCKDDLDSPPLRSIPTGHVYTIAELKALWTGAPVHFDSAMSVYAVVTSDENDGNFYKNISVQDHTGGITLRLINSGGLYVGDKIRIYLPGTVLSPYNGLMQLDSVNVDNNTIKQEVLVPVTPIDVTIDQLTVAALDTLQSMLIRVNDVEFTTADAAGGTWADAANQLTGTHYLENCNLTPQVMVRTSGYANYASQPLPTGKGSIVCIAGIFGSTIQLANRSMAGVNMNGARCPGQELPFFFKNFEDLSMTSGGWTQQYVVGNIPFAISSFSGFNFGRVTNYDGTANVACETWYISPSIDLTTTTAPKLSFRTACNYTGAPLEVMVSTDYVSGLPATATWTPLSATLSAGTWVWTGSGDVSLTPYIGSNVHFAFKYTGTASGGKNYELDDIKIVD